MSNSLSILDFRFAIESGIVYFSANPKSKIR